MEILQREILQRKKWIVTTDIYDALGKHVANIYCDFSAIYTNGCVLNKWIGAIYLENPSESPPLLPPFHCKMWY